MAKKYDLMDMPRMNHLLMEAWEKGGAAAARRMIRRICGITPKAMKKAMKASKAAKGMPNKRCKAMKAAKA